MQLSRLAARSAGSTAVVSISSAVVDYSLCSPSSSRSLPLARCPADSTTSCRARCREQVSMFRGESKWLGIGKKA
jgi:hypothetical protein